MKSEHFADMFIENISSLFYVYTMALLKDGLSPTVKVK